VATRYRDRKRMYLSVGYQHLATSQLFALVDRTSSLLVDVRARPSGRVKRGFSRDDLTTLLGRRYVWRGETLGNKPPFSVTTAGLAWLENHPGHVILMCQEENPTDCHRYSLIAVPLLKRGIDVVHLFRPFDGQSNAWSNDGEAVWTSELERWRKARRGDYTYSPADEVLSSLAIT